MTTLTQCSRQWASRPEDQRFLDLPSLRAKVAGERARSVEGVVPSRRVKVVPHPVDPQKGLAIEGRDGLYSPTHWSFGQLATLAGAPSSYLRRLPAAMAADCMNYGLQFDRDNQDVGLLRTEVSYDAVDTSDLGMGGDPVGAIELRAATGPRYGRVWNSDLIGALMQKFGDGRTGDFRVPGEFGKDVPITKANTTIYGSDRDVFVFLADENNRIDMKDRRDGKGGSLARGFFVWNSEVGSQSIGAAFFLFDYVCMNRIVWGVKEYKEIRLRHTSGAPDRWLSDIAPVLEDYSQSAAAPIAKTIENAQAKKFDDDLNRFLMNRFTKSESMAIQQAHIREEGRPIESLWDAVTGITAHAKTLPFQDARVAMEREAGKVLDLAYDF